METDRFMTLIILTFFDYRNKANAFNNYFVNIGPNLASKISLTAQSSYMLYLYQNPNQVMFIEPIDEHEISLITSELKSKASSGHDELSSDVLMCTMNYFLTPLVHIINTPITTGIVPINMKIARVTPVFKVYDKTEMSNYRPISILSLFSKILEKVMFEKTMNF